MALARCYKLPLLRGRRALEDQFWPGVLLVLHVTVKLVVVSQEPQRGFTRWWKSAWLVDWLISAVVSLAAVHQRYDYEKRSDNPFFNRPTGRSQTESES